MHSTVWQVFHFPEPQHMDDGVKEGRPMGISLGAGGRRFPALKKSDTGIAEH